MQLKTSPGTSLGCCSCPKSTQFHAASMDSQHRKPARGKRSRIPSARAAPQPPRSDTSPRPGAGFTGSGSRQENHAVSATPGTHRRPFPSRRSCCLHQTGQQDKAVGHSISPGPGSATPAGCGKSSAHAARLKFCRRAGELTTQRCSATRPKHVFSGLCRERSNAPHFCLKRGSSQLTEADIRAARTQKYSDKVIIFFFLA